MRNKEQATTKAPYIKPIVVCFTISINKGNDLDVILSSVGYGDDQIWSGRDEPTDPFGWD